MKIPQYQLLIKNRVPYLFTETVHEVPLAEYISAPDIVRAARDAFNIDKYAEEFVFLLAFDIKMHLIGISQVSHGTPISSFCNPREIFQRALLAGAQSIIVLHNHPSGDSSPSKEDYDTTKRLEEAGQIIGVALLDHIIVTQYGYYSFNENKEV